jgi:type II secretory pathway pseudopilin PulG
MALFNIPSIINLQPIANVNDAGSIAEVKTANSNLTTLRDSLNGTTRASILPSLTYQQDVKNILTREEARLADRKGAIDAADKGQKRMVDLTKNATQRNRAMNKMYITVVVALVIYLAIRQLVGVVSEVVTDSMMILLIAGTFLTLLTMYYDYNSRNNMDFDMINLGDPTAMTGKTTTPGGGSSAGSGLLQSRIGGNCVGDACCPTGTTYNEKYAICVPNEAPYSDIAASINAAAVNTAGKLAANYKYLMPGKSWSFCDPATKTYSQTELTCVAKDGFTTMMKTSEMAKPNDPFEFKNYNLYK